MGSRIFSVLLIVFGLGVIVFLVRSGAVGDLLDVAGDFPLRFGIPTSTSTPALFKVSERPRVIEAAPAPKPEPTPASPPAPEKPKIDPRDLPEGFTLDDISQYAGMIDLSTSRNLITIKAVFSGTSAVNVSGWTLKSAKRGTTFPVPQAVNIYDPSGLAPEGDVFLRGGELFKIHSGASAIGINFRLNKCTGYLGNNNNFSPSLPKNCPNPEDDLDMLRVSGVCQDHIRSLGSCRLPKTDLNVPDWDYVCHSYLDEINISGCYRRHRFDTDFLSREWWAWGRQSFTDPNHDTVLLLDRAGKLVDVYEY